MENSKSKAQSQKMADPRVDNLYVDHSRHWRDYRFVYPVLSRRAGGISLGVDLNPGCECTFRCVYCQVPKHDLPEPRPTLDLDTLHEELYLLFKGTKEGALFNNAPFDATPPDLRRINDIAFSGNGEPTLSPHFSAAVRIAAEVREDLAAPDVKLVLITNSTCLDRPEVIDGLETLMANNGEIWAKLDAGTESFYKTIDRSTVPFDKIMLNLQRTARRFPIVIQTLFSDYHGDGGPKPKEINEYLLRLRDILDVGGKIDHVQIHTVRRVPAEKGAEPLSKEFLEEIAERVRQTTGRPTFTYV